MKRLQKSLRKLIPIIVLVSAISCNGKKEDTIDVADSTDTIVKPKVNERLLIVPGKSIGNIVLEQNSENLETILGKPDLSDAAMGKAWLTWFSKVSDSITGNELNIYTEYKDNEMLEKVVRQIRVTSNEFKTADGISTGKTLDDISKIFPSIKIIGKFDIETPNPTAVYDAVKEGVAFETENNICTAIIIHAKGKSVSEEYISFHPDMKPM